MQNALEAEVQRLKAENERLETTASGCTKTPGPSPENQRRQAAAKKKTPPAGEAAAGP